jgi:hypothetical protein
VLIAVFASIGFWKLISLIKPVGILLYERKGDGRVEQRIEDRLRKVFFGIVKKVKSIKR